MSVWQDHTAPPAPAAHAPQLKVRRVSTTPHMLALYADNVEVFRHPHYEACHRHAMNAYRLTSTQALPLYADYVASTEQAAPPKRYRKELSK